MVAYPPLLVIVGPTGVGKTAVAVRLAARLPLEVVNADSRQVYRGMDIGTGKPTPAERGAVPHHLLDVVEPREQYHAARFRADALRLVDDIRSRGKLPAVVGGTGLYVRVLLKGLRPAPPADPTVRRQLEAVAQTQGPAALHARLRTLDASTAARLHPNDRVRLVRALEILTLRERVGDASMPSGGDWAAGAPPWRLLMIGLARSREVIARRIARRVRDMVACGMMEEVERLLRAGNDETVPAMGSIGYRQFCAVLRGRLSQAEALRLTIRDTTRYARRQLTWFARDPEIQWIDVDAAGGVDGVAEDILERIDHEGLLT